MKFKRFNEYLILYVEKCDTITNIFKTLYLKDVFFKHLRNKKEIEDDNLFIKDELWIKIFLKEESKIKPYEKKLDIVYEDDFILVVNKQEKVLVHEDGNSFDTLSNIVRSYYILNDYKIDVHPLHRLDKDTCGLIIFCKVKKLKGYFDNLIANKIIERYYYAVVDGYFKQKQSFRIDYPIGKDRHANNKYRISKSGKPCLTIGTCLKSSRKENISLLSIKLKTGRTHQIRVHLSSINHPILGDKIYNLKNRHDHLALQAYKLKINSLFHNLELELKLSKHLKEYVKILNNECRSRNY